MTAHARELRALSPPAQMRVIYERFVSAAEQYAADYRSAAAAAAPRRGGGVAGGHPPASAQRR